MAAVFALASGCVLVSDSPSHRPRGLRKFLALDLLDNRFASLHGLRTLAILSVLQFHVTWIFAGENGIALNPWFQALSLKLFFGMDLFFVLSGFLIGTLILHAQDTHSPPGTQRVGRFYLRRMFRTFPPYLVVLCVLASVTALTPNQRANLPYEFAFLTNWRSLHRPDIVMFWGWSLALEEQFYLVAPLLFWGLYKVRSTRLQLAVLGALWLGALCIRLGIYFGHGPWADLLLYSALYFRTPTRFDTLVCGIMLALAERRYGSQLQAWLQHPRHRATLALPAAAALWVLLEPDMFGAEHVQLVHVFAWGSITSLMWFAFLLLLLHGEGWMQRALAAPVFRYAATLGYGVYLVHIPLIDHLAVPAARALQARGVPAFFLWTGGMAAICMLSWGIAYGMHLGIEKPVLRLRKRWAD